METATITSLVQSSFENGISYTEYRDQISQLVKEGKTSGTNQSEALVDYTKLNAQRMNRWDKKVELNTELSTTLEHVKQPLKFLIITEAWCGDAAHNIPTLAKMADAQPNIELKLVYRDENLELMDQFLTNGGRSIPKVIIANENFEVLDSWGPRPADCQLLYTRLKEEKADFETQKIELQKWYNKDKQQSLMNEFCDLLQAHL